MTQQTPDTARTSMLILDAQELAFREYESLRGEIVKRVELGYQIIGLLLVAVGSIGAVAIETRSAELILLLPILTSFLAALWAHNDRRAKQLGAFVKSNIEAYAGTSKMWWETYRRSPAGDFFSLNRFATRGLFVTIQVLAFLFGASLSDVADLFQALLGGKIPASVDPVVIGLLFVNVISIVITLFIVRTPPLDLPSGKNMMRN